MEKQEIAEHNETVPQGMDDLKKTVTVDTLHGDEAVTVLANYVGDDTWTRKEEKKLVRKIDRRLLSILCVTYGLQYYDKAMLSQAAIFGLRADLQLEVGDRYSFSSSIFYLGFLVGSYPAILLAQRYPIERVASGIVTVWGACLMCTAACHNWQGLYVQRFFLGVIESGISPMFMLVVGGWYKKQEQALRMGAWYCCTGYVSIVSPLINYGLGHIKGSLSPWRYMYIVAGAVTIVWGALLYYIMPPDPIRARGFKERERYIAVARMRENNAGVRNTHFKWSHVRDTATDIRFWLMFAIAFLTMIANGPVSSFTPIIINSFGYSTLNSLLLTMPAGFTSGTMQILAAWVASKFPGIRTYIMAGMELVVIMSALLLWLLPRSAKGGLLIGVYFLTGFGAGYSVSMGLSIANNAGYTKRSVSSSGMFIGYCLGNFVGPLCFKPKDAPRYAPGFIVVIITSAATSCLVLIYRVVCIWENRKRDKAGIMESFDHAYEDDLTDRRNPQFRYTL